MLRLLWIVDGRPAETLRDALLDHGYVLLRAEPGERAIASAARLRPQAVLLDGAAAVPGIGRLRPLLPQAVLVARVRGLTPLDEVLLLGMGADLVVDPDQGALLLLARLRRWLQRAPEERAAPASIRLGPLELFSRPAGVRRQGQPLPLGRRAAALLHALAARNGGPASRDELAGCLGRGGASRSRRVDTAIWRLRQALQAQGVRELDIETVRGEGYRMVWRPPTA